MDKKGKEFNKENVIQTLRNHFGLNWDNRAKELNKLDNPDTYKGEDLRRYCRKKENADWYAEFKRKKGSHIALSHDDMHKNTDLSFTNKIKSLIIQGVTITEEIILDVAGMDKDEWKVDDHVKFNEWPTPIDGEAFYNFQFKVSFSKRPIAEMRPEQIIELLKNVTDRKIEFLPTTKKLNKYLYIPLADMHFGHNKLEDYEKISEELQGYIKDGYKKILISIHGDYFHVDNFLGTTEKGTKVDDIDFVAGIEDGYKFLLPLIELSIEYAIEVELVYLRGNHAPSIDFMFANAIKKMYPNITVDDSIDEYKCHWLGNNIVLGHHGDKRRKLTDLKDIFTTYFAKEWGQASSRYIFTGHLHHETSISKGGVTHYQVQSPSKASTYDKTYGFNTSEEGSQIFVFNKNKRKHVIYLGDDEEE